MKKVYYESPRILREMLLVPESPLLAGSVVNQIEKIESTGQELETFSSDDFIHNWTDGD